MGKAGGLACRCIDLTCSAGIYSVHIYIYSYRSICVHSGVDPSQLETQAFDGDYVAGIWSDHRKGPSFSSETSTRSGLTRASSTLTSLDDGEALPEPLAEEVATRMAQLSVTENGSPSLATPAVPCANVATSSIVPLQTPSAPASEAPCNALAPQTRPNLSLHAPTIVLDKCEEVEHNAVQHEQPEANPASSCEPLQVSEPKPPCTENHAADAEPGNCPAEDDEPPVNPASEAQGLGPTEQKPASTSMPRIQS